MAAGNAQVDAIVVGSGPNGLAAAVVLARAGLEVHVYEADDTVGGGARTAELTRPGFRHDICSAVHPLALASGFFRRFELERRVDMLVPDASYAHPLDGGVAGIAWHDLDRTIDGLGRDGAAWGRYLRPLVEKADEVVRFAFSPLIGVPARPDVAALVGLRTLESGSALSRLRFRDEVAEALLTGVQAHAMQRLPSLAAAGAGVALATTAHARGWAIPRGGSQSIADAMVDDIRAHGGVIHTGSRVSALAALPSSTVTILDVTPRAFRRLAGERGLPASYAKRLLSFRYGPAGAAKVDFALSGPVPWANDEVARAGTVHLGGTRRAIAASEKRVLDGRHSSDPYVLVSQPTVVDPSRAPEGRHTLWAYTHVPAHSDVDQTEAVTAQIERFAPGFRDLIIATDSMSAVQLERHDVNYVGGDIGSGSADLGQLLRRPVLSPTPWRTPLPGVYLASASVSPGPGVHGLAGAYAARTALAENFGRTSLPHLGVS